MQISGGLPDAPLEQRTYGLDTRTRLRPPERKRYFHRILSLEVNPGFDSRSARHPPWRAAQIPTHHSVRIPGFTG